MEAREKMSRVTPLLNPIVEFRDTSLSKPQQLKSTQQGWYENLNQITI